MIGDRMARFSLHLDCYIYEDDGCPVRYMVKDGRRLGYSTGVERAVNRGYYDFHEIRFDEEPDFDENDEDVGL